jgi:prevent-host-death family protein
MQWSLHDAKNKFSAVVEAARRGEPQTVTKRGVAAVVVLSAEEYQRLQHLEAMQAPTFKDHLLAMPSSGGSTDAGDFERMDISLRDLDL